MMSCIPFVEYLNVNEVEKVVRGQIQEYREKYDTFCIVKKVLEEFNGKSITKRIITKAKKDYPDYYFSFYHIAGMNYIRASKVGKADKNIEVFIGYDSQDTIVNIEKLEEKYWSSWENTLESASKKEKGLKYLPIYVIRMNTALKIAKEAYGNAEKYDLNYQIDVFK